MSDGPDAVHMATMKIYDLAIALVPFPFFGFGVALASLQRDRAALLAQHLPTAGVEASIASAGMGAVISFALMVLVVAAIAVFRGGFGDGGTDDAPEYGLAA